MTTTLRFCASLLTLAVLAFSPRAQAVPCVTYQDMDGDGFGAGPVTSNCPAAGWVLNNTDCNDINFSVNPSATELPGDNVDTNCDNQELCYRDDDNDNYRPVGNATFTSTANANCNDFGEAIASDPTGDCNDINPNVHPNATEFPADGIDSDCNGMELCFMDADNDGYRPGAGAVTVSPNLFCTDPGEAIPSDPTSDCNDSDDAINPAGTELPGDAIDSDCDGAEVCYLDNDDDGYRPDGSSTVASTDTDCDDTTEAIASDPITDCNDNNDAVNPGATDICDGIDNDCTGTADDGVACTIADAGTDAGDDAGNDAGSGASSNSDAATDAATAQGGAPGGNPIDATTTGGTTGSGTSDAATAADGSTGPRGPDFVDASAAAGGTHSTRGPQQDAGTQHGPGSLANDGGAADTNTKSGCNCRTAGRTSPSLPFSSYFAMLLVGLSVLRRGRRRNM